MIFYLIFPYIFVFALCSHTSTKKKENHPHEIHLVNSGHFKFTLPQKPKVILHSATNITDIIRLFSTLKGPVFAFPSDPSETELFLEAKEKYNLTTAIASRETMLILEDKKNFIEFCRKNDFLRQLVPKSYENIEEVQYPCVLKLERVNAASMGIQIVNSKEQLISIIRNRNSDDYQIQEAVFGEKEFTFYFGAYLGFPLHYKDICMSYKLPKALVVNRGGQNSEQNKTKENIESEFISCKLIPRFNDVRNAVVKIIVLSNFNGFGCVNFKVYKGELKIWEMNPRVCGGMSRNSEYFEGFMRAWWEAHFNSRKKHTNKNNHKSGHN